MAKRRQVGIERSPNCVGGILESHHGSEYVGGILTSPPTALGVFPPLYVGASSPTS